MNEFIKESSKVKKLWIWQIPSTVFSVVAGVLIILSTSAAPLALPFFMFPFLYEIYVVYKEIKLYLEINRFIVNEDKSIQDIFIGLKHCMIGNLGCKLASLVIPILPFASLIFKIVFCSKLKNLSAIIRKEENSL